MCSNETCVLRASAVYGIDDIFVCVGVSVYVLDTGIHVALSQNGR